MKTKITYDDVVKGFELLGINKNLNDVKLLSTRYQAMKNVQEEYDSINNAVKNKISKLEDMFKEFGITFTSDDVFATAFFQGEKLCQCEQEWADIYNVTIATLDKILKTFTSESQTEESLKLKNKWYDLFYEAGMNLILDAQIENMKIINNEANDLRKKSIAFYGELNRAQSDFYSLADAGLFEKYFRERLIKEENEKANSAVVLKAGEEQTKKIKSLFRENYIFLREKSPSEDIAFIVFDEGGKFLCSCEPWKESISDKALITLWNIKKAIAENDPIAIEHWKGHIDFFKNFNILKLERDYENIKKDQSLKTESSNSDENE